MKIIRSIQIIILISLAVVLLSACGGAQSQEQKSFTIGVVAETEALAATNYVGFKEGMAELGYIEDENVTYIYNGVTGTEPEKLDREIEALLAQDVDLLLTLGTAPTVQAKQATEGNKIPVVFTPVIDPVGEGIVESTGHPGGNITGIETPNALSKALEWLLTLAPASKVYVPYHPDDAVSVTTITVIREAAPQFGVEVMADEVNTPEDVVAAIESLPEDTVVLLVPVPSLEPGLDDYAKVALERGVVIGSYHPAYMRYGVLVNYSVNTYDMGVQASRLADQILRGGVAPADLPVETADAVLTINLATANAIGLEIPDDVLLQANNVIRGDE
jgi:putative ABC transport system substrate-binding protein